MYSLPCCRRVRARRVWARKTRTRSTRPRTLLDTRTWSYYRSADLGWKYVFYYVVLLCRNWFIYINTNNSIIFQHFSLYIKINVSNILFSFITFKLLDTILIEILLCAPRCYWLLFLCSNNCRWHIYIRKENIQTEYVPGARSLQALAPCAQGSCAHVRSRGCAHVGPRHALVHAHLNPPALSVHEPPCRQGADKHSSMSYSHLHHTFALYYIIA